MKIKLCVVSSILTILLINFLSSPVFCQEEMEEPKQIVDRMVKAIIEKNDPMRNRMFIKLRIIGKEATQYLLPELENPNEGVPEYVAFTLGWIADEKAVPHLVKMLHSNKNSFIRAAAKALGNMQAKSALPELFSLLGHQDPKVRLDIVYSLGIMRDESALPYLEKMLNDPDDTVKFFAQDAIDRIKTGW